MWGSLGDNMTQTRMYGSGNIFVTFYGFSRSIKIGTLYLSSLKCSSDGFGPIKPAAPILFRKNSGLGKVFQDGGMGLGSSGLCTTLIKIAFCFIAKLLCGGGVGKPRWYQHLADWGVAKEEKMTTSQISHRKGIFVTFQVGFKSFGPQRLRELIGWPTLLLFINVHNIILQ